MGATGRSGRWRRAAERGRGGSGPAVLRPARAAAAAAAAAVLAAGGAAWPASAVPAVGRGALARPVSLSIRCFFAGVATSSPSDAWAVGGTCGHVMRPILAHWDGTAWTQVSGGFLPSFGVLNAVTAAAGGGWAVGAAGSLQGRRPVILRLAGGTWRRVRLPDVGRGFLSGVAATSAGNAWAVGNLTGGPRLILRWNGRAWTRVPLPRVGRGFLSGVAATSARNAWAVGSTLEGGPLIMHWDGTRWRHVATPGSAGHQEVLSAVTATSATNAWAVGAEIPGALRARPVILNWNGTAWTRVPSPDPGGDSVVAGVDALSATDAWAVGQDTSSEHPLTLHWDGNSWTVVPNPGPRLATLHGVSIGPSGHAWAVGSADSLTLILHWNGSAWH